MGKSLGRNIQLLTRLIRLTVPPKREQRFAERELVLLSLLRLQEPCAVSAIRERLDVPLTMVSAYLKHLNDLGLIERGFNPRDGRSHLIRLTRKGQHFIEQIESRRGASIDTTIDRILQFSPTDKAKLSELVDQAVTVLQTQIAVALRRQVNNEELEVDEKHAD